MSLMRPMSMDNVSMHLSDSRNDNYKQDVVIVRQLLQNKTQYWHCLQLGFMLRLFRTIK